MRLRKEGIRLKRWVNRSGGISGGSVMCKSSLHGLLQNISYIGKVSYKGEVFEGTHDAIVPQEVFDRVQGQLAKNDRTGGIRSRNKHDALLRGLLCCNHCKTAMSHSFTKKKSGKVYRYYVCQTAMKESWDACQTKSVSAGEIEEFVVSQIQAIGSDAELQKEVTESFLKRQKERRVDIETLIQRYGVDQKRITKNLQTAIEAQAGSDEFEILNNQFRSNENALSEAKKTLEEIKCSPIEPGKIAQALSQFQSIWAHLTTTERCELISSLIEQISYDGVAGELEITWKENGINVLLNA